MREEHAEGHGLQGAAPLTAAGPSWVSNATKRHYVQSDPAAREEQTRQREDAEDHVSISDGFEQDQESGFGTRYRIA